MTKFYSVLLSFLLFSCAPNINYYGRSTSPTMHVDVFVEAADIKRTYTTIGRGFYIPGALTNMEVVQKHAIKKAQEKGADAILFLANYVINNNHGSTVATFSSDSSGKNLINIDNSSNGLSLDSRINILFLKYN